MYSVSLNIGSVTIQTGYDTLIEAKAAAREILVLFDNGVIAPVPTSLKILDPEGVVVYGHQF